MKAIFRAPAMLISLLLPGCASRPLLTTVPTVDLGRYAGKWYEISRYPNFFQRNCTGQSTAEYIPDTDGSLRVINSCAGKCGRTLRAEGRARVVPGSNNSKLRVSFGGPFQGDYWIIGLDEDAYRWAVVGHPSRKFLWVLARDPDLPANLRQRISMLVQRCGYDSRRLVPPLDKASASGQKNR